jgi:GTP cyclohydrolase I
MNKILKFGNSSISLTDEEKKQMIEDASKHFAEFLRTLKFSEFESDPNMSDTPRRVAKAYVEDLFQGCYNAPPKITAFDNIDGYDGIVFQGNIELNSMCSHHALPFVGHAHVAYIPSKDGKVIGLSKLNRIVEYFARRPQVQENLTMQIHDYINSVCEGNAGVAVMVEANHMCACVRGVRHDSTMMTSKMSGAFKEDGNARSEFYKFVEKLDKNK